jgi:type I restriction enzyme S subunit
MLRKDHWETLTLEELCEISVGSTPLRKNKDFWVNGTIPWFTIDDIRESGRIIRNTKQKITERALRETSLRLLPPETVLLCCTASLGEYAISKITITTNQQFIGLIMKDDRKIIPEYLFHYVSTLKNKLHELSGKTTIDFVPIYRIKNLEIPLPSIEEQKQIASLFQSIETAAELVEGQEKNLAILKKQLLKDLFGSSNKFGNSLTKQDFEPVKFEKLANNISERVEPKETDLDIYVVLEHLDPDCLTIERTGKPEDVIGTKLKIYKSDIIFGKRRAYLRKVAVSHFDGIASAHSMIMRANENNIEKDFLPYFMQSDTFMERAIQISEGSLSPTIKWKTLAAQEFVIPTKMKQPKLVEVFRQFDSTTQLLKQQKSTLKTLKQNLLDEILANVI